MATQPTKEKLYALRLHGMIEAIERQEQDEAARELNFLDRLALLIDQQWNWRENQALTRRVKASRLRGAACVEDIDYRVERGLNKSAIRGLVQESAWVKNHEHIFVLGPTGVGKSYVASALAQKACRDGCKVYYTRAAALFRDLNMARADASLRQLLRPLSPRHAKIRGSQTGRRDPRPVGAPRPPYRDARRIDAKASAREGRKMTNR